jgi:hypothetical protein
MIEFCFASLLWLPLLLGTSLFGMALIRAIQVSQLSRDSGHMYARKIDFTIPQNAAVLGRLASSLSIQQTGGAGAIVLSTVTRVTDSDCAAANLQVCPNSGKYVFTNFYVYGNLSYAQTQLGNPGLNTMKNGSAIQMAQYLSDPSLVATKFPDYLQFVPQQPGQLAYISEVTVDAQAISWSAFNNTRSYARTFF